MTTTPDERTPVRLSDRGRLRRSPDHTPPSTPPLVELHDVSLTQAHTRLIDRLDLTVHPGEHVALVGLSTAAATALTRLLTGQSAPAHGHLTTRTRTRTPAHTPHPTLAQAITGHPSPDPADPHLAHALNHTRLDPDHPHTPHPDLQDRIDQARDLYAQSTNARLFLLTDPPPDQAPFTPTPHTGLLLLTRQPTLARDADRILLLHQGRVTE
ncbi:ABC transporter ATP-binding protein, partial [Nocardiopsis sp. ATB16-24]|uniref:ABC transporter ATP-binding protein n=1 Tax=Nocardiopsis sp. ATB16-24 TaxID=3019555 RepID=UPI002555AEF1